MKYYYKTEGTCSTMIEFEIEDGVVHHVVFQGGCNGNLQGIARLTENMPVEEVIARIKGVRCKGGATSCPDQFARALEQAMQSTKS